MNPIILAALGSTIGYAGADTFTAILSRRVSGKAGMLMLTTIRLTLYLPFALLVHSEFGAIDATVLWWSLLLGILFWAASYGFNMSLQITDSPALVGVIAGCFPASASFVAIVFQGQRPSLATLLLLVVVLTGVTLIGLPRQWRKSLQVDKGLLLSLVPMLCWGVFGALLHYPVNHIHTPHGWFVVQFLVVVVMVAMNLLIYNRHVPSLVGDVTRKRAWKVALAAGIIVGVAEACQALALGSGKQLVIVEAIIGSYPAAYFLIAHKIFKEELHVRQWVGIGVVTAAIILLSVAGAAA